MKSMRFVALSLVTSLLAVSIFGQKTTPQELPDTQAGKRVAAYFKAYNSNDAKVAR